MSINSSGECLGEGSGTPLQHSCLENPMDGGAWWATVHGVVKSQTRLSDFTFTSHFHALEKEMALQCSYLENPRDRGAWWAAVYGVARSRTRLKRLSSSSSSGRSSLPPRFFSRCRGQGLLSSCGARTSHCGGFSCCRALALGLVGSVAAAPRF